MKNVIIGCILLAAAMLAGCARTPVSNQIAYLGQDTRGTLKMRVTGFGSKQIEIEHNAQVKAFEQLLYVGLPDATSAEIKNTDFRLPMVENKATVQGMPFLRNFFENKDYRRFVTELTMLDDKKLRASNSERTLPFAIGINYDAFRRFMEQNQVIRKFGY
ncbi:hypothetical protein GO755_21960 [Spirosoma sp. HMF4905]|uniref:Lipoprotein n=1 Tax=Spirosoma arboris TaxID=2682092 RepID=A0A7K1SFY9_9BACT|nr:hypothetical protein [Spirosoma arboris]MVM32722.1 hypothetical protein [Spirosoma arboris]